MKTSTVRFVSRRARGFTLVEALVALLALSIGLLGVAAMQLNGIRTNVSAAWRSQATYLAYDVLDRMRANRASRKLYETGWGAPPTPGGANSVVSKDLAAWKASVANTLPNGQARITVDGDHNTQVTIDVQWDDDRNPGAPLTFTSRSRL